MDADYAPRRALTSPKRWLSARTVDNPGVRWSGPWLGACVDSYWNGGQTSYAITPDAKREVERATFELHSMCLEMVHIIVHDKSERHMDLFEVEP
jgi:glutathionylspermidine synthase